MIKIPLSELEVAVLAMNPRTADTPVFLDDCRMVWVHARCVTARVFRLQQDDGAGFELRPQHNFADPAPVEAFDNDEVLAGRWCCECGDGL